MLVFFDVILPILGIISVFYIDYFITGIINELSSEREKDR